MRSTQKWASLTYSKISETKKKLTKKFKKLKTRDTRAGRADKAERNQTFLNLKKI